MTRSQAPVLIIGTGPVGLFQAYALSKLNVPVIVVGRHTARLGAPKAHALSPRSLEICRQFGLSITDIRSHPAQRDEAKWVRFVTNLSGEELGCLPYERMSLDVLDSTPEMLHNIAQPDFENLVMRKLEEEGKVTILKGWTWVSAQDHGTHVVSTLESTYGTGSQEVVSSVVIGCDGANSRIRKSAGITVEAEEGVETMMTIHFSADLRPVVKERVGMLHWIFDPAARGFVIAYDLGGNQVLIHNFDPKYHPLESFTPEKCLGIVKTAIGADVPVEVLSSMPWVLRRQVANDYSKGRIVLAGDSAHSFPPTGGLGLNSGIADAHNLAYKLARVYHHGADLESNLAAYGAERRPVAMRNSLQSVKNGQKVFQLLKSLKNTGSDVEAARKEMAAVLRDPEQRAEVKHLIDEQVEHFDNLMLHIGYVYEPHWDPPNATDFVPAYRPGARLPHAWIRTLNGYKMSNHLPPVDLSFLQGDLPQEKIQSWQFSTLDLISPRSFCLIYSADSPWTETKISARASQNQMAIATELEEAVLGKDFDILDTKAKMEWVQGFGLDQGKAVLVRPDQHVAKVFDRNADADSVLNFLQHCV